MVFPGGPLAAIARKRAGFAGRAHRLTVRAHPVRAVRDGFLRLAYGRSKAADLSRLRRSRGCARAPFLDLGMRARRIPADPQGSRRREYRRRRRSRSAEVGCERKASRSSSRTWSRFSKTRGGCSPGRPCCRLPSTCRRRRSSRCWRSSRSGSFPALCSSSRRPIRCRPFALGMFHTDPTHISPIPPERMRYSMEAAGSSAR